MAPPHSVPRGEPGSITLAQLVSPPAHLPPHAERSPHQRDLVAGPVLGCLALPAQLGSCWHKLTQCAGGPALSSAQAAFKLAAQVREPHCHCRPLIAKQPCQDVATRGADMGTLHEPDIRQPCNSCGSPCSTPTALLCCKLDGRPEPGICRAGKLESASMLMNVSVC